MAVAAPARVERLERVWESRPGLIGWLAECWLERLTVSQKRRTALSYCFNAIPDGKPLTLFLELL